LTCNCVVFALANKRGLWVIEWRSLENRTASSVKARRMHSHFISFPFVEPFDSNARILSNMPHTFLERSVRSAPVQWHNTRFTISHVTGGLLLFCHLKSTFRFASNCLLSLFHLRVLTRRFKKVVCSANKPANVFMGNEKAEVFRYQWGRNKGPGSMGLLTLRSPAWRCSGLAVRRPGAEGEIGKATEISVWRSLERWLPLLAKIASRWGGISALPAYNPRRDKHASWKKDTWLRHQYATGALASSNSTSHKAWFISINEWTQFRRYAKETLAFGHNRFTVTQGQIKQGAIANGTPTA